MQVTLLHTADDIFKYICKGCKVFCIDIDYPDAFSAYNMKASEILDYLNSSEYIFIAIEELPIYEF